MASGQGIERQEPIECRPTKDFLRHIVNHILSRYAEKIPISAFNEIRNRFSKAEEKYKFTVFGGDPYRLLDYLDSEDFDALITYVKSANIEEVLQSILKALAQEYRESCPPVAEKAETRLKELMRTEESKERQRLAPEVVYRFLKMKGYKVSLRDDGAVEVEGGNFSATIRVADSVLHYTICRQGKSARLESIESKLERIREL